MTKRERDLLHAFERHTGWQFMKPQPGESFADAWERNIKWLRNRIEEADRLAAEYLLDQLP